MHLTSLASRLVTFLAFPFLLLLSFVPTCLLALLFSSPFVMYYSASSVAAPRLNCSCICYGFDLREYVPGAVLRLTHSMKLLYAWDKDLLITCSCCMGSYNIGLVLCIECYPCNKSMQRPCNLWPRVSIDGGGYVGECFSCLFWPFAFGETLFFVTLELCR